MLCMPTIFLSERFVVQNLMLFLMVKSPDEHDNLKHSHLNQPSTVIIRLSGVKILLPQMLLYRIFLIHISCAEFNALSIGISLQSGTSPQPHKKYKKQGNNKSSLMAFTLFHLL